MNGILAGDCYFEPDDQASGEYASVMDNAYLNHVNIPFVYTLQKRHTIIMAY